MAEGVVVEKVVSGKRADREYQAVHVLVPGELPRVGVQRLLAPAEAEHLANEEPRGVVMQVGISRLHSLAIRESGDSNRAAEPVALKEFRVVEKFAALPKPPTEKHAQGKRMLLVALASEAVWALVGRRERVVELVDVCRLRADAPFGAEAQVPLERPGLRAGGLIRRFCRRDGGRRLGRNRRRLRPRSRGEAARKKGARDRRPEMRKEGGFPAARAGKPQIVEDMIHGSVAFRPSMSGEHTDGVVNGVG